MARNGAAGRRRVTQETVAKVIGKARNTTTELLSLNKLSEKVKAECRTSDIPKSVLIEVARVKSEPAQLKLWEAAKAGITVKAARQQKAGTDAKKTASPQERMLSAGRSFLRSIKQIPSTDILSNRDQYEELLELRREIDQAVDRLSSRETKES